MMNTNPVVRTPFYLFFFSEALRFWQYALCCQFYGHLRTILSAQTDMLWVSENISETLMIFQVFLKNEYWFLELNEASQTNSQMTHNFGSAAVDIEMVSWPSICFLVCHIVLMNVLRNRARIMIGLWSVQGFYCSSYFCEGIPKLFFDKLSRKFFRRFVT